MTIRSILPALVLLSSCTVVHYQAPPMIERTQEPQTIAILAFEVIDCEDPSTPSTCEETAQIQEHEGLTYQEALFASLRTRSSWARGKGLGYVRIQPTEFTNHLLEENDVPLRRSWEMSAETLADLLGVDAVLLGTVRQSCYVTQRAAENVTVGVGVRAGDQEPRGPELDVELESVPEVSTLDIYAHCLLLSGEKEHLLWETDIHREMACSSSVEDVARDLTRALAKRFPYRG